MSYQIIIRDSVIKALETIPTPYYEKLKEAIYTLAEEPRPQGYKKLKGREGYRIRVGSYRVIYEIIDNELIVHIIAAGHRKNIYR